MKPRSSWKLVALCVVVIATSTAARAETPPWWNDGQSQSNANANAEAQQKNRPATQPADPASGPILEEYTITRKPAQTLDERALEQSAALKASLPEAPP